VRLARLAEVSPTATLATDARSGLSASEKSLPSKYFYDVVGSELFDRITRLPEYYLTRTERAILEQHAGEIPGISRTETLVELGSGTSEKTRLLLSALRAAGTLRRFVAFDVDPQVLMAAGRAITTEYAPIEVVGLVGDFEEHLDQLPAYPHRMVAFLGSTIGNLEPAGRAQLLAGVRTTMGPDGTFLLGVDLVKSVARLHAAYDDSAGVTAAFNKNVLAVLNRELGATFDLGSFDHIAVWDAENSWVDIRLRSRRRQCVHIAALALDVPLEAGEEIRTEISAKFTRDGIEGELEAAGLRPVAWWTDPAGDFGLSLSTPDEPRWGSGRPSPSSGRERTYP
jgi:L-histidine Nalpha-methyltransferase